MLSCRHRSMPKPCRHEQTDVSPRSTRNPWPRPADRAIPSRSAPRRGPQQAAPGDACGLTRFGVNLVTLGPGGQSALRHWHTLEDEFVYVLEGRGRAGHRCRRAGAAPGRLRRISGRQARCPPFPEPRRGPGALPRDRQQDRRRQCVLSGRRPDVGEDENGEFAAHKDGRRY